MSTTQSQFPPDMAEVRWAIEVLEQRDARIHALLSVIGDSIDEDTIDHTPIAWPLKLPRTTRPGNGCARCWVCHSPKASRRWRNDPGHEYAILRYGGSASNH